jgi:hypothetical protein
MGGYCGPPRLWSPIRRHLSDGLTLSEEYRSAIQNARNTQGLSIRTRSEKCGVGRYETQFQGVSNDMNTDIFGDLREWTRVVEKVEHLKRDASSISTGRGLRSSPDIDSTGVSAKRRSRVSPSCLHVRIA